MAGGKILTRDVLSIIGIAGLVIASTAIPALPMALSAAVKVWKDVNKKELTRIVKRLEKQKMISFKQQGDKIAIEITEKGKRRLLEYNFEEMSLKSLKKDGRWRLVIFDIPNKKKVSRDMFRKKLKQLGFIALQESVFAAPFYCKDEIDFLCNYLLISDYVTLASINEIERGEKLLVEKY